MPLPVESDYDFFLSPAKPRTAKMIKAIDPINKQYGEYERDGSWKEKLKDNDFFAIVTATYLLHLTCQKTIGRIFSEMTTIPVRCCVYKDDGSKQRLRKNKKAHSAGG